jgi:hypothetical protein
MRDAGSLLEIISALKPPLSDMPVSVRGDCATFGMVRCPGLLYEFLALKKELIESSKLSQMS